LLEKENLPENHQEETSVQLHTEDFQIIKKWVKTSDVKIYKHKYTEEKQIIVPVIHEELVVEKKIIDTDGEMNGQIETIRIPLSEERIEIIKHPIILENIEINKRKFEELIHISEIVKTEKIHIETIGDIKIIEEYLQSPI
jgi:uncharacterized protein (TIGR02271 family)